MHWRKRLVIDWFLLMTLVVTNLTNEDPLFIFNLRKTCFAFIKNDIDMTEKQIVTKNAILSYISIKISKKAIKVR